MATDFKEYKAAFLEQNDLAHFGILGMKWGVRRYQNPDGSLTPAGRRRYQWNDDKMEYEERTKQGRKDFDRDLKEKERLGDKFGSFRLDNPTDEEKARRKQRKEDKENRVKNAEGYEDLVNDGFKANKWNDAVEKNDSDGDYISIELGGDGFKKAKESYDSFKKNKKEHVEAIINQILKNNRWDGWTDNLKQLEKEIRSAKNAYEFMDDGSIYGFIGNYGIPELGYHSIEIEYDPLAKRLHQSSLAG